MRALTTKRVHYSDDGTRTFLSAIICLQTPGYIQIPDIFYRPAHIAFQQLSYLQAKSFVVKNQATHVFFIRQLDHEVTLVG
jgi:hypothetical protein